MLKSIWERRCAIVASAGRRYRTGFACFLYPLIRIHDKKRKAVILSTFDCAQHRLFDSAPLFDLDRNDDIDEIIRRDQIANKKFEVSRVACVTQKNEDETLFNLFGSLFGEEDATKSQVFPTLGEALEWLGRPGTEAPIEKLQHHLFPASALST